MVKKLYIQVILLLFITLCGCRKEAEIIFVPDTSFDLPVDPGPRTAVIAIIHDDGNAEDQNVVPLLNTYGFKCGFALIGSNIPLYGNRYLDYQAQGYEILSHSQDHIHFSGTREPYVSTVSQAGNEFETSFQKLSRAGYKLKGWVTPYNTMNPEFNETLKKYYAYGFTDLQSLPLDSSALLPTVAGVRLLKRISMEKINTVESIKAGIDSAIAVKGLLVMYAHQYPLDGQLTAEKYKQILDYLKLRSNEKKCQVLTPYQAISKYIQWTNGD